MAWHGMEVGEEGLYVYAARATKDGKDYISYLSQRTSVKEIPDFPFSSIIHLFTCLCFSTCCDLMLPVL